MTALGLGERLRKLREDRGLSQAEIGRRIGVSRQTIHHYETNEQEPRLDNLAKLARVYGVSTDYILGLQYKCLADYTGLSFEQQNVIMNVAQYIADELRKLNKDEIA